MNGINFIKTSNCRWLLMVVMMVCCVNAWGATNELCSFIESQSLLHLDENVVSSKVEINKESAEQVLSDGEIFVAPESDVYSDWYSFVQGTQYKLVIEKTAFGNNDEIQVSLSSDGGGDAVSLAWGNKAPIGNNSVRTETFQVSKDGEYKFYIKNWGWSQKTLEITNFKVFSIVNGKETEIESLNSASSPATEVTISQNGDFAVPSKGYSEVENLTINLNLSETNWHPLYVPVRLKLEDLVDNFEVAKIMNFHDYEVDRTNYVVLEVERITSGVLKENHPYVIRKKTATGPSAINISNYKVFPPNEKNSITCASTETIFEFVGKYTSNVNTSNVYIMSDGYLSKNAMTNSGEKTVNACEWYMITTNRNSIQGGDKSNYSRARIAIRMSGFDESKVIEEMTTGVVVNNVNNNSEAIYTVGGTKTSATHKGINIIKMSDGSVKKIWVK